MAGLTIAAARDWWRGAIEQADSRSVILVARDGEGICGTVQVHPAWAPNQPHRAEVAKLLVHRRARRRGIGEALISAIERQAAARGFSLLTLDTVRGDNAERLYRRTWTEAGVIPAYALNPDGTPCDTVIFYKRLDHRYA